MGTHKLCVRGAPPKPNKYRHRGLRGTGPTNRQPVCHQRSHVSALWIPQLSALRRDIGAHRGRVSAAARQRVVVGKVLRRPRPRNVRGGARKRQGGRVPRATDPKNRFWNRAVQPSTALTQRASSEVARRNKSALFVGDTVEPRSVRGRDDEVAEAPRSRSLRRNRATPRSHEGTRTGMVIRNARQRPQN